MPVQSGPLGYDPSLTVAEQLADLNGKLLTMLKNRADYFVRVAALRSSIETNRGAIARAKAAPTEDDAAKAAQHEVLTVLRGKIEASQKELGTIPVPPPGEDSVQFKAIQARIATLEAQQKADAAQAKYHADYLTTAANDITAARAKRQAAEGVRAANEAKTAERLAEEAAANRLAELDGVQS